jgi:hypothetical protein
MSLAKSSLFPVALISAIILTACGSKPQPQAKANTPPQQDTKPAAPVSDPVSASPANSPHTQIYMHNVMLNENAGLKLRVRWLRGKMLPSRPGVLPSFDEPGSFMIDIEAGVVGVSFSDLNHALNAGMLKNSPLENVSIIPLGRQQIKLNGTLHKGLSLPIEMTSDLAAAPDGRMVMHVKKLRVLKLPVKGLLNAFNVKAGDLVDAKGAPGVEVAGDDIYLDPEQILPPPRKRGKLTDVHIGKRGDIVEVYGDARPEVMQVREWRNFIELEGGALEFGKLTMHHTDLVMIDISNDDWFKFDLPHYQAQLVYGYTRMTPQAGLRIYMPDIDRIPPNQAERNISLQWLKNRNLPPPGLPR